MDEKKETPQEEPVEEPKEEDATGEEAPEAKEEEPSKEIDYDAEIAKEKAKAPDPEKAREAFKLREQKRKEREEEEETPEDQPLTRKDLEVLRNEWKSEFQREALHDRATSIAQSIAGSDKEAELIVARWQNRVFPSDMTLNEQIEEMYASVHAKRLIGERNEALRALKGRAGAETSGASTHRDAPKSSEPQVAPQDAKAIKAAGFVWNGTTRRYEKKLPNGALLVRDSKTGKAVIVGK